MPQQICLLRHYPYFPDIFLIIVITLFIDFISKLLTKPGNEYLQNKKSQKNSFHKNSLIGFSWEWLMCLQCTRNTGQYQKETILLSWAHILSGEFIVPNGTLFWQFWKFLKLPELSPESAYANRTPQL
jgi:hypothetical protein